jgi:hypothetical protein
LHQARKHDTWHHALGLHIHHSHNATNQHCTTGNQPSCEHGRP